MALEWKESREAGLRRATAYSEDGNIQYSIWERSGNSYEALQGYPYTLRVLYKTMDGKWFLDRDAIRDYKSLSSAKRRAQSLVDKGLGY